MGVKPFLSKKVTPAGPPRRKGTTPENDHSTSRAGDRQTAHVEQVGKGEHLGPRHPSLRWRSPLRSQPCEAPLTTRHCEATAGRRGNLIRHGGDGLPPGCYAHAA